MDKKELRPGILKEAARKPTMLGIWEYDQVDGIQEIEDRARRWGIPIATINDMNFGTWDARREGEGMQEATDYATAFAHGRTEFSILTLSAPIGTGKTHLALAVAWNCLMNGYLVYYRQQTSLLDDLRRCFNHPHKDQLELDFDWHMDTFKSKGVLIIDDLGVSKPTEWSLEQLEAIIDYRWANNLPLMVTTNALGRDLPPRIADRISDVHRAKVVTIVAESYRRG